MEESVKEEFRLAHERLRAAIEAYDELFLPTRPRDGARALSRAKDAQQEVKDARAALKALRGKHGIPDPDD